MTEPHHITGATGFLLTRQWRETRQGIELTFWAATDRGPIRIVFPHQEAVYFAPRTVEASGFAHRQAVELWALDGAPVDALYFSSSRALVESRERLREQGQPTFESDIKPADRFLMERFITGGLRVEGAAIDRGDFLEFVQPAIEQTPCQPNLKVVSLDIETEGFTGALYSIAVATPDSGRVFMVGEGSPPADTVFFGDEASLLTAFFSWFREEDPDLILGWNIVAFDLQFIRTKCTERQVSFAFARGGENATILPAAMPSQSPIARLPGRVVLDGIDLLRTATWTFEQYGLDYVARELLGRGKNLDEPSNRLEEIRRLYREDKASLAAYNLEDCRLVLDIFAKTRLIEFAVERANLTGLPMDRQGGSVAAFDYLYLPRLHRKGYVAWDVGHLADPVTSPGGYVMESSPGLFENVLVLDFKSLYPSIIRTFCIDPLGLAMPGDDPVPGFEGASFHRTAHILPGLIETLWAARDKAKREKNAPLSQAIKIIMNSFYGVLGTPGCRFFNPKLASSITLRGHEVITRSRDRIESMGFKVIYGDTDSVFVLLGPEYDDERARATGDRLAAELNAWWAENIAREHRLTSYLDIEFEKHFVKFLMPTIRGAEKGSKKRYAGSVRRPDGGTEVVFRGLETVRTDWTPLARSFQRELYRRVFAGEPYVEYVHETARAMLAGELVAQLVYRKRLRRALVDYTKNVPPHVRAARQQDDPGRWVAYYMTIHGPEPADQRQSPLDYAHYLDRQLAPVADTILHFVGTSFDQITNPQMELF